MLFLVMLLIVGVKADITFSPSAAPSAAPTNSPLPSNCDLALTLPQYTATPEYLLFYLDLYPRPFVILSPTDTVYRNENVFNSSSNNGYINFNGYTGEEWQFSVTLQTIDSVNETSSVPTLTRVSFVVISGYVGITSFYSVHYIDSSLETGLCSVYGTRLTPNAPLLSESIKNAPVDVLLQGPLAIGIISDSVLKHVLCPHTHDVPAGWIKYTSSVNNIFNAAIPVYNTIHSTVARGAPAIQEELLTSVYATPTNHDTSVYVSITTGTHVGFVNTKVKTVQIDNFTRLYASNDHTPLITSVSRPITAFAISPSDVVMCSNAKPCILSKDRNVPQTGPYDIVLKYLNSLPVLVLKSMLIPVNKTHNLVFVHAGTPLGKGMLGGLICSEHPRHNGTTAPTIVFNTTMNSSTSLVGDVMGSHIGFYAAEIVSSEQTYVYYANQTAQTIHPMLSCDGIGNVQLVGLCGVASVCVDSASRVSIHALSVSGAIVTPWANWTHQKHERVKSIHVVPTNVTTGGCKTGSADWSAFVVVVDVNTGLHYVYNYTSSGVKTLYCTGGTVFFFETSHDLYLQIVYLAQLEEMTIPEYWMANVVGGNVGFTALEYTFSYTSCYEHRQCNVTIQRTVGGNMNTHTIIHSSVPLPFLLKSTDLAAHAHVYENNISAIPSFVVNHAEGDVFIYVTETKEGVFIHRCYIELTETIMYCEVDSTNVTMPLTSVRNIVKSGQLIAVDFGPANRWIFNTHSFVRSGALQSTNVTCWAGTERSGLTLSTRRTHSIGGIIEYARQYASSIPGATRLVGMFPNILTGNIVSYYSTASGYVAYDFNTACYFDWNEHPPPSNVKLSLFFPSSSSTCINMAIITANDTNSLYVGTSTTTGCKANEHIVDATCVETTVPLLLGTEYVSHSEYCDASVTPTASSILRALTLPYSVYTRNVIYRKDLTQKTTTSFRCETMYTWRTTGNPQDVLYAYTGTPVLYDVFEACETQTMPSIRNPYNSYRTKYSHVQTKNMALASPVLLRTSPIESTAVAAFEARSTHMWGVVEHLRYAAVTPLWMSSGGLVHPYSIATPIPKKACPAGSSYARTTQHNMSSVPSGLMSTITLRTAPDMVCLPTTRCVHGLTYEITPPSLLSDRVCVPVKHCRSIIEYESIPPTITSDRVCALTSLFNGESYHISVAATPTSNTQFRRKVLYCRDDYYLNNTANSDAQYGRTQTSERCIPCSNGTTATSQLCYNSNLTVVVATATSCAIYVQYHSNSECVEKNMTYSCGVGKYYNLSGTGHPWRNCYKCKTCGRIETPCTRTSNTVCGSDLTDPPSGIQQCAMNTYRDDSSGSTVGPCLPCTICPSDLVLAACTPTHNTICTDYGSKSFIVEVIFVLLILFWVWILVFRLVVPILMVIERKKKENINM